MLGYQGHSDIDGVIFTKVKGVARSNEPGAPIYDASDLVIPAAENKAVFITTRTLSTIQSRGQCPDNSDVKHNRCNNDGDCRAKETANGYLFVEFIMPLSDTEEEQGNVITPQNTVL